MDAASSIGEFDCGEHIRSLAVPGRIMDGIQRSGILGRQQKPFR